MSFREPGDISFDYGKIFKSVLMLLVKHGWMAKSHDLGGKGRLEMAKPAGVGPPRRNTSQSTLMHHMPFLVLLGSHARH